MHVSELVYLRVANQKMKISIDILDMKNESMAISKCQQILPIKKIRQANSQRYHIYFSHLSLLHCFLHCLVDGFLAILHGDWYFFSHVTILSQEVVLS